MLAQFVSENLEFNFKEPPYKRYVSKRGVKGPQIPNPKKKGYGHGLSDEEIEIIHRHQYTINDLRDEIDSLEGEIEDLKGELHNLNTPPMGELEMEQYYADLENRYGVGALDILNSGIPRMEKINGIDALNPRDDKGLDEIDDMMEEWAYYHPDEPDPKEIDRIESEIDKFEDQKEQRENTKSNLETKIYNIENY